MLQALKYYGPPYFLIIGLLVVLIVHGLPAVEGVRLFRLVHVVAQLFGD